MTGEPHRAPTGRKARGRPRRLPDSPETIAGARANLSARLPALIGNAVAAYEQLAVVDPAQQAKDAAKHHAACRAALSHLDLLAKLARWAEGRDQTEVLVETEDEDHDSLVARARAALEDLDDTGS